jgi:hypothetical protein
MDFKQKTIDNIIESEHLMVSTARQRYAAIAGNNRAALVVLSLGMLEADRKIAKINWLSIDLTCFGGSSRPVSPRNSKKGRRAVSRALGGLERFHDWRR